MECPPREEVAGVATFHLIKKHNKGPAQTPVKSSLTWPTEDMRNVLSELKSTRIGKPCAADATHLWDNTAGRGKCSLQSRRGSGVQEGCTVPTAHQRAHAQVNQLLFGT